MGVKVAEVWVGVNEVGGGVGVDVDDVRSGG